MTSSDPENIKDIIEQMSRLDPDSPEFDVISEKPANLELPASPPEIYEVAGNPKITFQQFEALVSGNLSQTFEGQNLLHAATRSGKVDRVRWLVDIDNLPRSPESLYSFFGV